MEPGEWVVIDPPYHRDPYLNNLRGRRVRLLWHGDTDADVLVAGVLYKLPFSALVPDDTVGCARCGGTGTVPVMGVSHVVPGRRSRVCTSCGGQGYLRRINGELQSGHGEL